MINVNADRVKKWRRVTKQRMIESLGGKCGVCGYDRCQEALECHHLDPTQKEFSFGQSRANIKAWSSLVPELRKCVLLCANCHREIHAGMIDEAILQNLPRFNEQYLDYKRHPDKALDACPICGKLKPLQRITCSKECAGKKPKKVDWNQVNLTELISTFPSYEKMGESLGVTGAAVKRQLRKVGLV